MTAPPKRIIEIVRFQECGLIGEGVRQLNFVPRALKPT